MSRLGIPDGVVVLTWMCLPSWTVRPAR
jgi:hypothetical protein